MKSIMIKHRLSLYRAFWITALLGVSTVAHAASIGDIANTVTTSVTRVAQLVGAWGYAVAFVFALGGIFKLKQYGDDSERYSLRPVAFLFLAAVLSAYMTSIITTGRDTLWNGGAQTQGIDGSGISNGL